MRVSWALRPGCPWRASNIDLEEKALRLKIHVGGSEHYEGQPAYKAVVLCLGKHGVGGATITRGVYESGKRSRLHAATPLRLSEDLSMIIEAVDSEKRIVEIVPIVGEMVRGGLVTVDEVRVLCHIG